jgi:integrase
LEEFSERFLDGYARANRQKPSGVSAKATILRVHLVPRIGSRRLDQISTEDVQRLKADLGGRASKTVNNVLTVLNVLLKTAVAWGVIDRMPCTIKLVKTMAAASRFLDFNAYERLVDAAGTQGSLSTLVVLLGGDAGLRCGEMMALKWCDIDFTSRQLTVAGSEWKGHLTPPKSGKIRHVPLTRRLAAALREARHSRSERVLIDSHGRSLTQRAVQGIVRRAARRAGLSSGVHTLRHSFCSHLAMRGAPTRAIQELAGHQDLTTTQRYMHLTPAALESAIGLLDRGRAAADVGEIVETVGP